MKNKDFNILLIGLVGWFSLLFFGTVLTKRALWWDEAAYIAMGKWFFSSGRLALFDTLRPPLFPLFLGFFWKIGINPRVAGIISNFFFDIISAFLIYKISQSIVRREYQLLLPAFFLINPVVIFFNSLALTESLATMLLLFSVYFYLRKKYYLSGVFVGLTFLTRFPFGLILVALILQEFLFSHKWEKIFNPLKIIFSFVLTILPYLAFNYHRYNHHLFYPFESALYTVSIARANNDLFFYFTNVLKTNPFFIFAVVPLALLIIQIFHHKLLNKKEVFLLFLTAVSFILPFAYFTHTSHKEVRYALSFIPFLAILSGYGIYYLCEWGLHFVKGIKRRKIRSILAYSLLFLVILSGSGVFYKYIWDRFSHPSRTDAIFNHKLNMVRENLSNYLNSLNSSTLILTNDIAWVYYTNDKVVSLIFPSLSVKILHIYKGKGGFIVLNTCQLKCYDNNCLEKKRELMNVLSNYTIMFKTESFGNNCTYVVYKNR